VALAAGQKAELDRERRQRQDALERLASSAEASARQKADAERERRDKDEATKALAAAQQDAAEQKAARERAEALLASVREEAAREQAVHAAAGISATADAQALQERVMELERTAHIQKEELEAARQALADARTEIEGLHTAQREAARDAPPTTAAVATAAPAAPPNDAAAAAVPTALAPPRPRNPCGQALQGKVPTAPRGSRTWSEASLARLCKGAEASAEPARCYEELMRGKVRWGKGNTWTVPNAVILCAGTHNARETLDCFASSVTANEGWSEAINKCRTAKP
jgi:hypothetical protein